MKIAFVVRNYHKSGGISRCAAELAEYFSKYNEVHVFAASWCDVNAPGIIFHKVPMLSFAAFKKRKWNALNNVFEIASFALFSFFMVKPDNFDIVHSHGSYAGKSDIFTTHSCHAESLSVSRRNRPGFFGKLKKTILNPLHLALLIVERRALKNAKKIIAVSGMVKKEIIKRYDVPAQVVEVIPNGVNLKKFSGECNASRRASIRGKHGFKPQDKVIIFPAHEFERKGLRWLIEALNIIQDKSLFVIIAGQDNPEPFVSLIKKYGLEKNFIFAGNAPDIQNYFSAADLMAFPTYYEPFGLVILEAMSSGLPVIVSRCAGASELIDDNVNGRILEKHDDTRALAQMIMHYTANAETAKSAGQNAKNTAARYCWDEIAGKTYKIYEGIIVDKAYQSGFAPVAPSLTRREHAEIKNV